MTNVALYRSKEPSALGLVSKTHLELIALFPGGRSTSVHVSFAFRGSISVYMACTPCGELAASLYVDGS